MFMLFLALTIVFAFVLVTGFVWGLIDRGQTTRRSGSEVGAELMAEKMTQDSDMEGKTQVTGQTWFRGKGVAVDREAEYSYAEIKRRLQEGDTWTVLPALLVMAGMVGLTFFLALTLLVGLSNKIFGLIFLLFGLYSVYLIIRGFIKEG